MNEYIVEEVPAMTVDGRVVSTMLHKKQELVRCKDCEYGFHLVSTVNGEITIYHVLCTKPYIEKGNATHEPDWYCADGERKTD